MTAPILPNCKISSVGAMIVTADMRVSPSKNYVPGSFDGALALSYRRRSDPGDGT